MALAVAVIGAALWHFTAGRATRRQCTRSRAQQALVFATVVVNIVVGIIVVIAVIRSSTRVGTPLPSRRTAT